MKLISTTEGLAGFCKTLAETAIIGGEPQLIPEATAWPKIRYGLSDVTHLRVVFEKLRRQLDKTGRLSWIAEEMAALNDPAIYRADPEQAWRRLKPRGASPRLLGTLKEVAAWRERTAQRIAIPRQRRLRDEQLLEIASHTPTTTEDLAITPRPGRGP